MLAVINDSLVFHIFSNTSQNNIFSDFIGHWCEIDRPVVFRVLLLALPENWDVCQLPVSWDVFGFPRGLKNQERFYYDIWWIPSGPTDFYGSSWSSRKFSILAVMLLHLSHAPTHLFDLSSLLKTETKMCYTFLPCLFKNN